MHARLWSLAVIAFAVAPEARAAPPSDMISVLRSVCLAAFGDLPAIRSAALKSRLKAHPISEELKESLVASRGRLYLVYRGAPDGEISPIPQCFTEIPAGKANYETVADLVQRELRLGPGNLVRADSLRITRWTWRDARNEAFTISLTAEQILEEQKLRLSVDRQKILPLKKGAE